MPSFSVTWPRRKLEIPSRIVIVRRREAVAAFGIRYRWPRGLFETTFCTGDFHFPPRPRASQVAPEITESLSPSSVSGLLSRNRSDLAFRSPFGWLISPRLAA